MRPPGLCASDTGGSLAAAAEDALARGGVRERGLAAEPRGGAPEGGSPLDTELYVLGVGLAEEVRAGEARRLFGASAVAAEDGMGRFTAVAGRADGGVRLRARDGGALSRSLSRYLSRLLSRSAAAAKAAYVE